MTLTELAAEAARHGKVICDGEPVAFCTRVESSKGPDFDFLDFEEMHTGMTVPSGSDALYRLADTEGTKL